MKGVYFLLLAFLVITSLAVAPHYDQRDIELPVGAYWEGNTVVLSNDIDDDLPELDGEQEEITTEDLTVKNQGTDLSNVTTTTLDKRDWPSNLLAIDVRTGGPKQHVGTLRKQRLYNAVYSCLQLIGHQGNGLYKGSKGREQEICHQDMWAYCQMNCKIPNIVYNSGGNTYATNAYLNIWVGWSEFKENDHAGIREVAYKFAATIYKMQLEESENCYLTEFKDSRVTMMCNVPRNVIIVWPVRNNQEVAARLNVNVEFNGKTTHGKTVCENNLDKIKTHFRDTVQGGISKVMNWPKDDIVLFNSCQKDACFDIGKAYWPGATWQPPTKTWIEPKGCEPTNNYIKW